MTKLPPKFLLISVLMSITMQFILPVMQIAVFPFVLIGMVIVVAGWILNRWSERVMEGQGTTVCCRARPTALVTTGPFAFSRNPFYLGYFFISLGAAVMLGSLGSLIGPILFFGLVNFIVIPREESVLESLFRSDFVGYRREVGRWLWAV